MEDEYQLIYFDYRGICEPIRLLFAICQVDYQDIRIPIDDGGNGKLRRPPQLPSDYKDEVPFGKLPMLKFRGKKLVSSKPICRYLAAKLEYQGQNLLADSSFDDSKCDEYMDAFRDYLDCWKKMYYCQDEERQKQLMHHVLEIQTPKYLGKFDQIISENKGHLISNKLTWADIYLASCVDNIQNISGVELLDNYPSLRNLVNSIFSIPSAQQWTQAQKLKSKT